MVGTLKGLPVLNRRKVGMTSSPHGPYVQGYTRATMATTKGREPARGSKSQKSSLSTDRSLQLDSLKAESLVIADQQAAVNTFPGLVHTPVTPWESVAPEVVVLTRKGGRRPRSG